MATIASAALALGVIGGARMIRQDRQRGLLMIAAAIVIFANVLIWTV